MDLLQQLANLAAALPPLWQAALGGWTALTAGLAASAVLARPRKAQPQPPDPTGEIGPVSDPDSRPEARSGRGPGQGYRPLRDLEVGMGVQDLPSGVFAFVGPGDLGDGARVAAERDERHSLEVLTGDDDLLLACFLSQEAAHGLETGRLRGPFLAYPLPWTEASTPVEIRWSSISIWSSRSFRGGEVLELLLRDEEVR